MTRHGGCWPGWPTSSAIRRAMSVLLLITLGSCAAVDQQPAGFRYAIDEGTQRLLYLSGGTRAEPALIRLRRQDQVLVVRETRPIEVGSIDVCRRPPPDADARWWSAEIDDDIARAIRSGDRSLYALEALVESRWVPLDLRDSGCRWRGGG